jgi:hypothetical protein
MIPAMIRPMISTVCSPHTLRRGYGRSRIDHCACGTAAATDPGRLLPRVG